MNRPTILFVLFVLIILSALLFYFTRAAALRRLKGKYGERIVNRILSSELDPREYVLLKDVTLWFQDGTTQIDHILVSPFGVFVIETKTMKGWIFGRNGDKQWTQTIFGRKFRFQNPLRQNYKHTMAVASLCSLDSAVVHPVIILAGSAVFRNAEEKPPHVLYLDELLPHIRSYTTKVFSGIEFAAIYDKLDQCRLKQGRATDKRHQEYLHALHGNGSGSVTGPAGYPPVQLTRKKRSGKALLLLVASLVAASVAYGFYMGVLPSLFSKALQPFSRNSSGQPVEQSVNQANSQAPQPDGQNASSSTTTVPGQSIIDGLKDSISNTLNNGNNGKSGSDYVFSQDDVEKVLQKLLNKTASTENVPQTEQQAEPENHENQGEPGAQEVQGAQDVSPTYLYTIELASGNRFDTDNISVSSTTVSFTTSTGLVMQLDRSEIVRITRQQQ